MVFLSRRPAALAAGIGLSAVSAGLFSLAPAQAQVTAAKGIIARKVSGAVPSGADAVRVTVLGDGSGAKLQLRLLETGESGTMSGYYAAPPVTVDFKGWKTLTFPLSTFAFGSKANPDAQADGTPGASSLASGIAEIQMVVTAPSARLFFDDLDWTTASAAPTDAALGAIDSFDGAASEWAAIGDWEVQRAVSVGLTKFAQNVKNGTGSLQLIVRTPGLNEQQIREPTLIPRLSKTPTQSFVVFSRPALQTVTLESTPIPRDAPKGEVALTACADEIESGAFSVFAARPLKSATVKIGGPLARTGGGGTIAASNIDVRVVKISSSDPDALQVLVKDDREAIEGATARVRLTGDPICDIPENASKRFWVTVKVPANQKPGVYTTKLILSGQGSKPVGVPLSVEVLPLTIKTAFLQYGIDLRSRLGGDAAPGETIVSPETFAAQLADIRDHGIRFVVLHDKPGPDLQAALKLYKDAGLSRQGPIVVAAPVTKDDVTALEAAKSTLGLGPEFLIYYAIPPEAARSGDAARDYALAVRDGSRSSLLVSPIDSKSTYSNLGTALDVPNYNVSSDYAQKLLVDGKRGTSNRDWWNWSIGNESPLENRLLAGFLLYKTGSSSSPLYGALPGPYDKAVVPVEGGVLDTVQWEAVREGIDDIRYIGILKSLIRELRDLKAFKADTDLADSYLIGALGKPLTNLSPAEQQEIRRNIITRALKLQTLLIKAGGGK